MSEITESDQNREGNCSYCGAELDPNFYFCTKCATRYTPEENVLPARIPEDEQYRSIQNRIKEDTPQVHTVFWTYFAGILISGLLSLFLGGLQHPEYLLLFQSVTVLTITVVFSVIYYESLTDQFSPGGLFHYALVLGVLSLGPLLLLNYGFHWIIFEYTSIDQSLTGKLREMGFTTYELILLICLLPAITEEVAFRGLLQKWLGTSIGVTKSIIVASGLFAAMHFSVLNFPYLFLLGSLFGWVKWKTGSLLGPMLLHFLHNFFVISFFHY